MKLLYLSYCKIKNMIKEDKFFFLILFVGILTCNIMFIYMYGTIMQSTGCDGTSDIYLYDYRGEAIDKNIMHNIDFDCPVYIEYYININNITHNNKSIISDVQNPAIRAIDENFIIHTSRGSSNNLNSIGSIVIPEIFDYIQIGEKIIINNYEFTVIGISAIPYFVISNNTFKFFNEDAALIAIDTRIWDINDVMDILKHHLPINIICDNVSNGLDENIVSTLILILIIYLLSAISFLYLMKSIYDNAAYELTVYEIIGAEKWQIIFVLSCIMLFILGSSGIISEIIHIIFYDSLFSSLNVIGEYIYTFKDYLVLFVITFISVYIFVFSYILIRTNKSLTVNIRKFIS